ncbi:phage tail protein [Salmonella enterica subsp. enterica serovar Alachua]|nr:phage tail protein [Salmonella enterica subsp. enterica serovar Alachua]
MSDSSNLLAGTAYVTVDGVTVMVEGSFKYKVSKVKRETLVGMDGIHGYKETPVAGSISFSMRDGRGTSMTDLNGQTNVTVVAQLANGKTIIGSNMWTVDDQEVDSEDAKVDVKWEGMSVTEN